MGLPQDRVEGSHTPQPQGGFRTPYGIHGDRRHAERQLRRIRSLRKSISRFPRRQASESCGVAEFFAKFAVTKAMASFDDIVRTLAPELKSMNGIIGSQLATSNPLLDEVVKNYLKILTRNLQIVFSTLWLWTRIL